ncbi:S-methyl-5-thioribose-1-phosphate isomerase [Cadophora gregata]|uniref:S-methyl-5-thioribose-1-phosphate isomerase n=1 Tax=Cadophora gregata TaxID=51156 RepID=UPI0026DBA719|nr:S-methyl-5-thioribose-1-phosphate isomerase [Cadophora gregata]KAK0119162.1 S-methyl-5-thioribose-1-phosphate isomerase [Cadophora gregata f. sp. sojae]KAK0126419.1 S-methyl-5-thioribose-1-phosphate isomerase [Cadophora gregata]
MAQHGLQAIKYSRGKLEVLDQLKLPHEFVYDQVSTCEEAFDCIKAMRVRGAPAIAIVAALALAVELEAKKDGANSKDDLLKFISSRLDYLMGSRPTAVDLSNAIKLLKKQSSEAASNTTTSDSTTACANIRQACIDTAEKILDDDLATNRKIGRYGAEYLRRQQMPILTPVDENDELRYYTTSPPGTQGAPDRTYRKISVLTHCNTGSLATSGHGTALGIIRSLHNMNYLDHAFCTETRPYNQGSRLTAFELVYEKIPSTLITDSMAGALFARKKTEKNIMAVIVGADRVARNGDTANKIGTYSLAVLAKYHGIKFIVAAPTTSIDLETETGASIRIEDRAGTELTQITGAVVDKDGKVDVSKTARVAIADQRVDVWNPSFDVTPHELIDAIITEEGEVLRNSKGKFSFESIMPERWAAQVVKGGDRAVGAGESVGRVRKQSGDMQFPMDD